MSADLEVQPRTPARPIGRTLFLRQPIQLFGTAEEPLFLVDEVRRILGFVVRSEKLLRRHPDNEKTMRLLGALSFTDSRPREAWFVNEPGLYRLIFKSRRPEAEKFKTWVFNEVLPSIRKYGQFPPPKPRPKLIEDTLRACFPAHPEFQALPLRHQLTIAARLSLCAMVAKDESKPVAQRCKSAAHTKIARCIGMHWLTIYRHYRVWKAFNGEWQVLKPNYHLSGRKRKKLPQ